MKTSILPNPERRLSRPAVETAKSTLRWMAAAILAMGLIATSPADAATLSASKAKATASKIQKASSSQRFNLSVTAAHSATKGITASKAPAAAVAIVSKLSAQNQRALAGRVAIGIALNYPQQLPKIVGALLTMNSNMRKNGYTMVYQASVGGGFDQAAKIANEISKAMGKSAFVVKDARKYAEAIMAGIWNRATISQTDRLSALGAVAGYLLKGLVKGSTGHGSAQKVQQAGIKAVINTLSKYMKQALKTGSDNKKNAVYQMVGNLELILKQGTNSKDKALVDYINKIIKNVIPPAAGSAGSDVGKAINDVKNGTGSVVDVKPIVHPETPYIDPDRTSTKPAF